jgi:predicted RNA binding protein YcfA (HicA-like mRNA interferase family)
MTRRDKLVERIRRRPPTAKFSDVRLLLEDGGWILARTKGSHHSFTKPGSNQFTVPVHNGDVKRVYLDRLCELLGLDEENETG